MPKKLLYLVGILLVVIVGSILFWNYCCNCGVNYRNREGSAAKNTIASIPDEKKTDLTMPSFASDSLKNWKAIREKLNANSLLLYFETNKSEVHLNPDEIQKLDEINDYLKNDSNGILMVTGHSDNTGEHAFNIKLGLARANFVKDYLVSKGADEAKITSSSNGPDNPAADNNTSEGRAKNRRVVILIK